MNKVKGIMSGIMITLLVICLMPVQIVHAVGNEKMISTGQSKVENQKEEQKEEQKEVQKEEQKEVQNEEQKEENKEGTDAEDETREDSIIQVLTTNPEDAGEPVTICPTHEATTYSQNIFYSKTTLHGIFSSNELYFNIPQYWDTKYVYAELQYDVSELIRSIASSMTFSVNNVPISSCRVKYEDGNTQTCYVEIPMELIKEGFNSLSISAYARLYDEEGCIDDFTNANWLSISDSSYIQCGYEVINPEHKISYYPYPFTSTIEDTGKGLSIVVPDKASDGEVEAAMNLMADLSTETGDRNEIQFCLLSDLALTNANRTIIISNYENLPATYQNKIMNKDNLDKRAEVVFTDDEKGNPLLLITSKKDECLVEAAFMLMDENRVSQEKSNTASVNLGSAEAAVNSTTLSQMVAGNYTVKDIIGSGLTFVGPFHQEQIIYLPFSEDYFLSDAGKVTLKFRYSENLDFNRSLVSVSWGDIPVASKKLQADKAGGDELTFAMPADVVGTTTGAIRIAFDLEIPDMICTPRQEQMPWAYVSDESVLYLPASTGIVLTFDLKPSPFRTDGKFNDMMLVISDNPTTAELNLYAQIIGMYGDGVKPYGTLYVRRNSEFTKNDADYNIITIGTYQDNPLIQTLNDNLYFSYEEGGMKFKSNEQLILSDQYAQDVAILQLLESPFASNRGILAITGAHQDTLAYLDDFIREHDRRYSLTKDCVIVDKDLETKAFQFRNTIVDVVEPGALGEMARNKRSVIFTIIATAVMGMMLIAVIIMLIRIKMYHKKNEE